jgi:hypothetical protein
MLNILHGMAETAFSLRFSLIPSQRHRTPEPCLKKSTHRFR